jgi:rare lipoprotein A
MTCRRMIWRIGAAAGLAFVCGLASEEASAQDPQQFFGLAAHYSKGYEGAVASGERYDPEQFTAAHRTLPLGTRLRVTDPKTHRSVEVVVNDRGPFTKGYVIDLSFAAAKELHMIGRGLIEVTAAVQ